MNEAEERWREHKGWIPEERTILGLTASDLRAAADILDRPTQPAALPVGIDISFVDERNNESVRYSGTLDHHGQIGITIPEMLTRPRIAIIRRKD